MRRIARAVVCALALAVPGATVASAQRTSRRAPPPQLPLKIEPAKVHCRESLGTGVRTMATYCFVQAGRAPAEGVLITLPPHAGPATVMFHLHNRHTFSQEDIKAGRGFASYRAGIGVLTMTGELLGRGAVATEFRTVRDLFERIGGGAGPGGVKAVAPIGNEEVIVTIPAAVTQVSLLGEYLDALTAIGRETATPGRPVAIVSNVRVEYRPLK